MQTDGVAMGNSLGPIAANLFMINLEKRAKQTALRTGIMFPALWLRYVDDVLAHWLGSEDKLTDFLELLNALSPKIRFTIEKETKSLPFMDVLIERDSTIWFFQSSGSPHIRTDRFSVTQHILEGCSKVLRGV